MANQSGEAANYYNQQPPPPPNSYQQYPPQQEGYSNGNPPVGNDVPPPYPPPESDPKGSPPSYDELFAIKKPKWNDLWAGFLFLATCAGFIAVSGISIQGYSSTRSENSGGISGQLNTFGLTTHTIWLFFWVLLTAIVLSYAYMWMARKFTKQFVWLTGILNIIFGLVTAIYMLSRRYYSGGIVFLIFSVFMVICFLSWRSRIPFSVLMLQTAIDVAKKFGHVYLVSAIGGLLATVFAAWFSVTLVSVYVKYEPSPNNPACSEGAGGCSSAKVAGLVAFITFAAYWISSG